VHEKEVFAEILFTCKQLLEDGEMCLTFLNVSEKEGIRDWLSFSHRTEIFCSFC